MTVIPYRADSAFHPPVAAPRTSGLLPVSGEARLYFEEVGPEDGAPVLVLHGGPGGAIRPYYRRLLDPRRHRGVFFDQRGCGRSTPSGGLLENTTQHLVADIEALRQARGIDRWTVVGGSWGSTLALAYAQSHPDRVTGLVVSGVYLARREDLHWWWEGARAVFPETYAMRDAFLTPEERNDPRAAFQRRILDADPAVHRAAAMVLAAAEVATLDLYPSAPPDDPAAIDDAAVVGMRIFAHYDAHQYFLKDNQLLRDAARLGDIDGAIIAGRSDMCTPPKGAYDLAEVWPRARLQIIAAAGHRWSDEHLGRAIVPEIARIAEQGRKGS